MAEFDQLPECSYRGIVFPLESSDMEGGNDFVEHTAYRRRGADSVRQSPEYRQLVSQATR